MGGARTSCCEINSHLHTKTATGKNLYLNIIKILADLLPWSTIKRKILNLQKDDTPRLFSKEHVSI